MWDLSHLDVGAQKSVRKFLKRLRDEGYQALLKGRFATWAHTGDLLILRPTHRLRIFARPLRDLTDEEVMLHGHLIVGGVLPIRFLPREDMNKVNYADLPRSPAKTTSVFIPEPPPGCVLDVQAQALLDRDITLIRRLLNDDHLTEQTPKLQGHRLIVVDDKLERLVANSTGRSLAALAA